MTESSNVGTIVDYVAAMAGGIQGVKAVFGAGQGVIADPLRPGQKIEPCPSNPTAAYSHWTELPNAPAVQWVSQGGTVELTWNLPSRLWFPSASLADVRRMTLPFYDRYLRALILDHTLGGNVLRSQVQRFATGGDKDWAWLDIGFVVVERVNYSA